MGLAGALDKKRVGTSHALIDDGLHFAIAEAGECGVSKRGIVMMGDFFGEALGGGAGEKFDFRHDDSR